MVSSVEPETKQYNSDEVAALFRSLIEELEENYPTNTTSEQMIVATKIVEKIENNPTWKQRVITAFKQGSLKAMETHPIGAFIITTIKVWQQSKAK